MPIEYYIINAIVGCGLTFLIKDSVIMSPIRKKLACKFEFMHKMLVCSFCTGVWMGFFLGGISFFVWPTANIITALIRMLYVSMIVATCAYVFDLKTRILENEADR